MKENWLKILQTNYSSLLLNTHISRLFSHPSLPCKWLPSMTTTKSTLILNLHVKTSSLSFLAMKQANAAFSKISGDAKFLDDTFFKSYQKYSDIVIFIQKLKEAYPKNVQTFVIGKSVENKDIVGIRVFGSTGFDKKKPSLFLNSLQHAREWLAGGTTLFMIREFLIKYAAGDRQIVDLLNKASVHLIPVVNPDGYEYSFTSRMWRKNRAVNRDNTRGVDLNRNFKMAWGGPGSSNVPGSETYHGPSALSEPESQAIDNYLQQFNGSIRAGIDYHSFSQLVLRPWDYKREASPDEAKFLPLSAAWRGEMRKVHNVDYQTIRGAEMYIHSGGLLDHFYGIRKFWGFCVELRPRSGGFVIDPKNIIPSGQENFAGAVEVLKYVVSPK